MFSHKGKPRASSHLILLNNRVLSSEECKLFVYKRLIVLPCLLHLIVTGNLHGGKLTFLCTHSEWKGSVTHTAINTLNYWIYLLYILTCDHLGFCPTRTLQNKVSPMASKLKYLTGEWFYEAKSQRHNDKIHGSEIILASMKQKRAATLGRLSCLLSINVSLSHGIPTQTLTCYCRGTVC